MTAVMITKADSRPAPWRLVIAAGCLVLAAGLLTGMTWSVVRVAWFTHTSDYCATVTCTGTAMGEASATGSGGSLAGPASYDMLMVEGESALEEVRGARAAIYFGYLPMAGLALLAVLGLLAITGLAWGWSPATWMRRFRRDAASPAVQVALVTTGWVTGFVLVYLANWQSMMWLTHVTE